MSESDKFPPTGPDTNQPIKPVAPEEYAVKPPTLPEVASDPLDKGDTLQVGAATVLVSEKDGKPYVGGSSAQGYVTSEDTSALPITFSELETTLKSEVLSGKKTRQEAIDAIKAFASDHNLPASEVKLTF